MEAMQRAHLFGPNNLEEIENKQKLTTFFLLHKGTDFDSNHLSFVIYHSKSVREFFLKTILNHCVIYKHSLKLPNKHQGGC